MTRLPGRASSVPLPTGGPRELTVLGGWNVARWVEDVRSRFVPSFTVEQLIRLNPSARDNIRNGCFVSLATYQLY